MLMLVDQLGEEVKVLALIIVHGYASFRTGTNWSECLFTSWYSWRVTRNDLNTVVEELLNKSNRLYSLALPRCNPAYRAVQNVTHREAVETLRM